jgi:hypothetical protein
MNLIINPSQPPGYTRPINNGSTRFALPIPGHSRLKPELEKTSTLPICAATPARVAIAAVRKARPELTLFPEADGAGREPAPWPNGQYAAKTASIPRFAL